MNRVAVLAFCLLGLGGFISCRGAEKSPDQLSAVQIMSLQDSQTRVAADDRSIEALRHDYEDYRVSRRTFDTRFQELTAARAEELQFQKTLLTKQHVSTGKTDAVLRTVGKLAYEIPLRVLMGILQSGGNFSP